MAGTILYDLTPEKYHWIRETIPAGAEVEEFRGCTYGCISPEGIAVSLKGQDHFTEVPVDAVRWETNKNRLRKVRD